MSTNEPPIKTKVITETRIDYYNVPDPAEEQDHDLDEEVDDQEESPPTPTRPRRR